VTNPSATAPAAGAQAGQFPAGPGVTFLFTDIEGSTALERSIGSVEWAGVIKAHDDRLRGAIESAGGFVVKTEGDAVFATFATPAAALAAIVAAQQAIAAEKWPGGISLRIRAGLHTGEGRLRERRNAVDAPDYVGIDVNYTARIAAAANGGQVLVSNALAGSLTDIDRTLGLAGATLVDEGLRTVKDFEEPARVFRLVIPGAAEDERPLRTLDAPSNLPQLSTSLVGRDAEIEAVARSLDEGRIVTLTGPGGSGKTRLALGAAESVRTRFPHGTWFVDLAAIHNAALLESTIGEVVGLREPGTDPAIALRAHLRDRQVLLLLDNLEQLLPDAAARVAALVRGAPGVRILATSRELLRISGERGIVVPPLDVAAGARLFEERARAQRPDLPSSDESEAAIRAIAERLGGLPLAIELAAARIRLLSPQAILERLGRSLDLGGGARDVPERQRTLRGAIDWSHDLLSEDEQRLFRRLGVFSGGWEAEAAQAIVDPDADLGIDLLDALESLADKSLVRIEPNDEREGETRFSMHPLLREYALEHLRSDDAADEIAARHARVFGGIAEDVGPRIFGPEGESVMRRLDHEQHNMRAAIDWSMATGERTLALRIVAATWRWHQQRGRLREARSVLASMLDHEPAIDDPRLRIAGLAADGGLAYWTDDIEGARRRYEERVLLAEALGDPLLEADAHYDIGFVFMVLQDGERLRQHTEHALELYTGGGNEVGVTRSRQALVLVDFLARNYAAARDHEEELVLAFRAAGSMFEVADGVTLLSGVYTQLDEPHTAWERMTEGLRIFVERDAASGLARSLAMAAIIQLRFGDPELGARIAGATRELGRRKNVMVAPTKVLHLPEPADLSAEALGTDRAAMFMAEGAATDLGQVINSVLDPASAATLGAPRPTR
jgi:predicted ATPase/class 3 adenylate cyclase